MDYTKLCINCMHQKKDAYEVCDKCGFDPATYRIPSQALVPFAILNGRYLVGRVLGIGGFGIVYLAFDMALSRTWAVKEFFVNRKMHRSEDYSPQVEVNYQEERFCQAAREKFIHEANVLAHLKKLPGISLNVYDYFEENGTSYMVMDYLEGKTLKKYVSEKGGKLAYTEVLEKLHPLIQSLQILHERDVLHRDISPDNLMVREDGSLTLFDFGDARVHADTDGGRTNELIMLKPGYSPIEQYPPEGTQGPWTDEYAVAATIYYCVCGTAPTEARERIDNPNLLEYVLRTQAPELPEHISNAILKGMGIYKEERFPDMSSFEEALYQVPDPPPNHWWKKIIAGLLGFAILIIVILVFRGCSDSSSMPVPTSTPTPIPTSMPTPVPTSTPTPIPTNTPTPIPTNTPTPIPTSTPTPIPTSTPTPIPTSTPTPTNTPKPDPTETAGPNWQRIYSLENGAPVGAVVRFGSYPQDSSAAQMIEWFVVDKDEEKVLLVSKYLLDRPCAHNSAHWEGSEIRSWLNEAFIDQAFISEAQRARICVTTIDNNSRKDLEEYGDENKGMVDPPTEDRVFLLSIGETTRYLYDKSRNLGDKDPSMNIPTKYAVLHGASVNENGYGGAYSRTFSQDGTSWRIYTPGEKVGKNNGVRPAMWIYTGPVCYEKDEIKTAQEMLNSKGYNCGNPDGNLGKKTMKALKDYQEDYGLCVTGILTVETAISLSE